jgi:hypothetical protein
VQTDLREELSDPPTDLYEVQSQSIELHSTRAACDQLSPQSVQQPMGRCVQQQPKLVGDEPMTAQAIGFEVNLKAFDPVLALSTSGISFV